LGTPKATAIITSETISFMNECMCLNDYLRQVTNQDTATSYRPSWLLYDSRGASGTPVEWRGLFSVKNWGENEIVGNVFGAGDCRRICISVPVTCWSQHRHNC